MVPPSVLTSSGQDEFKFGRSIPLLLTYSGQDEFKFGTSTSRLAADLPSLVLTSSGQV